MIQYVRKHNSLLWEQMDTDLLSVEDYLLELARLCEALDDLVWDVGPQVDAEGQCGVHRLHQVPQLLRALELHTHTHTNTFARKKCFHM